MQLLCCAGGTHHAFRHRGEGFCVFNDIAVAAAAAMEEYGIQRVLVIDLDVHQGNGTASIFEEDARVTSFDMHGRTLSLCPDWELVARIVRCLLAARMWVRRQVCGG